MISPLASPFRGWRNLTPMRALGRGASGQFVPQQLGHTALYDANNGGSATQITDSGGGGVDALAFAASTAAPTYVPYSGTPFVRTSGVNDNYVRTPHSAAHLWVSGALRATWCGVIPTPNGSLFQAPMGKLGASVATTCNFVIRWHPTTAGAVEALVSNGASAIGINLATLSALPTNTLMWFDLTWNAGTGAWVFQYNLSTDPATEPSSWTSAGSGTSATFTPASNSEPYYINSARSAQYMTSGLVSRALLRLGGSLVFDWQAALSGQTGHTDSLGNVWTVAYSTSGLAGVVKSATANDTASGVLSDGSNDYATGPTAAIPALTAADACTLYTVTRPRATMSTNMTFFSTRSGTGAGVTLRMASATTVVADISDGTTTVTTPAVTITPGTRYVLGVVIPTSGGAYCFANNTTGSTQARTGNTETGGALTVFANSTPTNFCRTHARVPYAALPYAVNATQLASLVSHFGGGL